MVEAKNNTDDVPDTQETQAATQEASQVEEIDYDSELWGCLQPCKSESGLERIDFRREQTEYKLGRGLEVNDIQFPGMKISMRHCKIIWDGTDADTTGGSSSNTGVQIYDSSTNGTFINGQRVKKNGYGFLRDGNELALGPPATHEDPREDYRFIYRHLARKDNQGGIHAVYEFGSELGKGSFATVMKGMHKQTGEWYAIKIIHNAKIRGPTNSTNMTAFKREVAILEGLDHPHICKFKEVFWGQGDDDTYLVLELVNGKDLLDYILRHEGLEEDEARRITYHICDAMAYIHSKGVAHRDLKPENVLMTRDDPPIAKVADFGLAKFVDPATMLKTMCGTPSYLAPEVITSEGTGQGYDNLVDSWSVGVIVYSMLTNTSPFSDPETDDVRAKIRGRTIDWELLKAVYPSEEAWDFVHRLLETSPKTRMTLTDALQHPWLASYSDRDTMHVSHTRPGTPEPRTLDPDSSILSPGPDSFSAPNNRLRISPSQQENGAHGVDLSLEENGNLGLNGLKLSPNKRNLRVPEPSTSAMPGAFPRGSGSRGIPLERRASVLARQEMAEALRKTGPNRGTATTPPPEESWQIVQVPSKSPRAGEKRRARPMDIDDDAEMQAVQGNPMAEPLAKKGKRNASSGKPRTKAVAATPESPPPRRSTRNKRA